MADMRPENSVIFGRTFVAFTLQAAIERAGIPREQRYPAFLFLDEASETLDSSAQKILETARKYAAGVVAAHATSRKCAGVFYTASSRVEERLGVRVAEEQDY